MRIETKGLLIAVTAALVVLGATFGVATLIGHGQTKTAQERPSTTKPGGSSNAYSAAQIAQGHQFYTQSCASCHGSDAKGGFGPDLHHEDMSDSRITKIIKNGKGRMPAFSTKYSAAQTQAIVGYIRTLN